MRQKRSLVSVALSDYLPDANSVRHQLEGFRARHLKEGAVLAVPLRIKSCERDEPEVGGVDAVPQPAGFLGAVVEEVPEVAVGLL